jgi:hypothetical protein
VSRQLHADRISETIEILERRIRERFPDSSLRHVAQDLHAISQQAPDQVRRIRRPNLPLRLVVALLLAAMLTLLYLVVQQVRVEEIRANTTDLIQTIESSIGAIVFLGAAMVFLLSLENRGRRKRSLADIEKLRGLAHVIDMHQLNKDPERVVHGGNSTESSPQLDMSAFELGRYLDYCSELLALIGKVCVVYTQGQSDSILLSAVDDVETLSTGLSRKMWQKLMVLHSLAPDAVKGGTHERGA